MATTYISYNIWYNGVQKAAGTQVSPVNIVYNGVTKNSITGNAIVNCKTTGKYCGSNIIIGGNTAATAGKYCESDITIKANTSYVWNRYSVTTTYNQNKTVLGTYNGKKNSNYTFSSSAALSFYLTKQKGSYTFSNGKYTLQNVAYTFNNKSSSSGYYNFDVNTSSAYFILNCTSGESSNIMYEIYAYPTGTSSIFSHRFNLYSQSNSTKLRSTNITGFLMNGSWQLIQYSSTQSSQRGTYIDQVTSTSSSAYPINGVSGNYWYTQL